MAVEPALTGADIARYFHLILGRAPENEAVVQHYVQMGIKASDFVRVLMDSEEVTERYRRRLALAALDSGAPDLVPVQAPGSARVLLFGAYGNGNLGDSAQAEALGFLLRRLLPMQLSLGACSWERRAPFAFPGGARFAADALLRAELLPPPGKPGLVVIGGGGLLGAPHFPLHAQRWAAWFATRGVPWALLGVGGAAEALAEPAWAPAYRILLEGAAFVGVRDAATLAACRAINPNAAWFPDPVLARALLETEATQPDRRTTMSRPVEALIIPRHPNSADDNSANQALLACRDTLLRQGRRVVVAALEGELDAAMLKGSDVVYVDDWATLIRLCRKARTVVSLRLHGVIAGIAADCMVRGLVQPKIGDLMTALGVRAWFTSGPPPDLEAELTEAAVNNFRRAVAPGLARMRTELAVAMQHAAQALGSALGG